MFKNLFDRRKPSEQDGSTRVQVNSGQEITNCPFCNSASATVFSKRADIVTCSSCGLIYLRTRPDAHERYNMFQQYADESSYMHPPDNIAGAKQSGLRRKHLVNEIINGYLATQKGVWLDIGCGWGAMLDEVRERGYTPEGLELTRKNVDFAVMQLQLPVSNSQLDDARIDAGSCTVISMIHVLGHLPYPMKTLKKVYASLEEDGLFCGILPNIASFCSEIQKDDWPWLDPTHHLVHYSPATLSKALVAAGFTVEKIYTDTGDYDRQELIKCVSDSIPGATPEKVGEQIAHLISAGKGEEIRFFARKSKNTIPAAEEQAKEQTVSPAQAAAPAMEEPADQQCPCCRSKKVTLFRVVSGYNYYRCSKCECLFIDTRDLARIDAGFQTVKYEEGYWKMELSSARERSYGPALARMAEAIYYCKRPVKRFLDIGTGPGYFLDAVGKLLPDHADVFFGIELFPPDVEFRTTAKNYIIGDLGDLADKFDCGICVEVIEHLTPVMLDGLLKKLAAVSNPEALYIFNTGMPEFVIHEDIGYLDPTKRGHLVSYSINAMDILAGKYGFTAHRIPGKTWAFVLEYTPDGKKPPEDIRDRIWTASEHNKNILTDRNMGSVLKILGLETSRAYH